jgi:hypothetical protein
VSKKTKPINRKTRARFAGVREKLHEYGARSTESIPQAVDRLITEHRAATIRAQACADAAFAHAAEAKLAKETRDGAQALATANHKEARDLRRVNEQLRHELDAMRGELCELRAFFEDSKPRLGRPLPRKSRKKA